MSTAAVCGWQGAGVRSGVSAALDIGVSVSLDSWEPIRRGGLRFPVGESLNASQGSQKGGPWDSSGLATG